MSNKASAPRLLNGKKIPYRPQIHLALSEGGMSSLHTLPAAQVVRNIEEWLEAYHDEPENIKDMYRRILDKAREVMEQEKKGQ